MFLHEVKKIKYWISFRCYVLVISITLKKGLFRSNFSDNYVQLPSSMHSNVQLLYLLLFWVATVVLVGYVPYLAVKDKSCASPESEQLRLQFRQLLEDYLWKNFSVPWNNPVMRATI